MAITRYNIIFLIFVWALGPLHARAETPSTLSDFVREAMGVPTGEADPWPHLEKLAALGFPHENPAWTPEVRREAVALAQAIVVKGAPRHFLRAPILAGARIESPDRPYGVHPRVDMEAMEPVVRADPGILSYLRGLAGAFMKASREREVVSRQEAMLLARASIYLNVERVFTYGLQFYDDFLPDLKDYTGLSDERAARLAAVLKLHHRWMMSRLRQFETSVDPPALTAYQAIVRLANHQIMFPEEEVDEALALLDHQWPVDDLLPYAQWKVINLAWALLNLAHARENETAIEKCEAMLESWREEARADYVRRWIEQAIKTRAEPFERGRVVYPEPEKPLPPRWDRLWGLCQMLSIYANGENGGKYPELDPAGGPDESQEALWDRLIQKKYFNPQYLIHPSEVETLEIPEREVFMKWPRRQRHAWLRNHMGYVMIPGRRYPYGPEGQKGDENKILFMEKLRFSDEAGLGVVTAGCRPKALPVEAVRKRIEEATGRTLEAWSGAEAPE